MIRVVSKLTAPLKRRVMLMIGRAVIHQIKDDAGIQVVQLSALQGEVQDDVERFQEYGFTSVPLPGSQAVIVSLGGMRSHSIVIAVEDRKYRLKALKEGEVALYDDLGQKIHLKRTGIVVETTQAEGVILNTPKAVINSDNIHLGDEGGSRIAREGDQVNITSGSSAGMNGVIAGGSDKVRAA